MVSWAFISTIHYVRQKEPTFIIGHVAVLIVHVTFMQDVLKIYRTSLVLLETVFYHTINSGSNCSQSHVFIKTSMHLTSLMQ